MPPSARERELVARFADAVESGDVDGVVTLLVLGLAIMLAPAHVPGLTIPHHHAPHGAMMQMH